MDTDVFHLSKVRQLGHSKAGNRGFGSCHLGPTAGVRCLGSSIHRESRLKISFSPELCKNGLNRDRNGGMNDLDTHPTLE